MKNVMTIAWEIAKTAATEFGGSSKEYFAASLKLAWAQVKAPKKTEIRFPYCKKHWVAKIVGSSAQYKLSRDFLEHEEAENDDIVYGGLTDGYYQVSRFGKPGDYKKISNGIIIDVEEQEVTAFFNAPKKGMRAEEVQMHEGENGYGERYEFGEVEMFELV